MGELQETVVETTATEAKTAKDRDRALQAALDRDLNLYGSTVGSRIKYAQHILQTQTELGGGTRGLIVPEWERFKAKMKGSPSDISKYCSIAKNPYFIKSEYWPNVPNAVSILYELAVWMERVPQSQEQWETLIDVEGNPPFDPQDEAVAALYHDTIHPRMTRADAEKLAGKKPAAERAEEKKRRNAENQPVLEEEHLKAAIQLQQSQTPAASAPVISAPAEVSSESASESPVAAQRPQEQEPPASHSASVLAPSSSIAVVVEPEEREDGHEDAVEEPSQPATEEPQLTPEEILAAQDMQDAEDDSDIIVYQNFMDTYQQLQLRRLVKKFMNDNRILYKTVEIELTITKPDQEGKAVEPATQKKQMNRRKM